MIAAVVTRRPILRSVNGILMRVSERNRKYASHFAGPPRVRISFAEKAVHGILISLACGFTPLWVSQHISEYKGKDEDAEE